MKELEIPKTEVKDAELKLAAQLIDQQAADKFDPGAYTDTVKQRIEAAIRKKVEGQEIAVSQEAGGGAEVIDLMEALRRSLKKGAPEAPAAAAEQPKPAKRAQASAQPARKAAKK
jgi:DNA end-binding protein Ku